MTELVAYAVVDRVAVLTIDNPPMNALSAGLRAQIWAQLDRANADAATDAIVLTAAGQTFPAGADVRDYDNPSANPSLGDLCDAIEGSPKPVVAALHGAPLGGGFEIALAAQARIAARGTRVGLPDIGLGLIPDGGGTQRLPRLVDTADALDLMLKGKPMTVARALSLGAVDTISDGDLLQDAVALAQDCAEHPREKTRDKRDRFKNGIAYQQACSEARTEWADHQTPAALRLIECVEAAPLLPFDAGRMLEAETVADLVQTPESKALRHMFFAERRAAQTRPKLPNPVPVRRVGIVTGGQIGAGVAVSCLLGGLPVVLFEATTQNTQIVRSQVHSIFAASVKSGRMPEAKALQYLARLEVSTELAALSGCDLVLEAGRDDEASKVQRMASLAGVLPPQTLVASHTRNVDLGGLARAYGRVGRVVGLHFFAPSQISKLCEVVVAPDTDPQAEATAFEFIKAIRKTPIWSAPAPGFVVDSLQAALHRAADELVLEGASPYAVDGAMRGYGFNLGPYQTLDLAGLNTAFGAAEAPGLRRRLLQNGWLGRASGRGFYKYEDRGARAVQDAEVLALVDELRAEAGQKPRSIGAVEIQTCCVLAMMNAGAGLLANATARAACDIDVAAVLGTGFPRHKGGPMRAFETSGLLAAFNDLQTRSKSNPFWTPSPRIKMAAMSGNRFDAQ